MENCRRCACNLILATGTLERLEDYVSLAGMAGTGERYTEPFVGKAVSHTHTALSSVEETCHVDLSDVKVEVDKTHGQWLAKQDEKAFEHALEASAKFEQKFCKTRVDEE